jgi:DNA polymerase-3 subunit delta
MQVSFQSLWSDLEKKRFHPVYFLYGDESYFIDMVSDFFENRILSDSEKAFNLTVLYGHEVDHKAVIDSARRYPVMAPEQVVILKEAQYMKTLADLSIYIENPLESTHLIICYKDKRLDKRTGFAKHLLEHAVVVESRRLYDNKVPNWVVNYLGERGYRIGIGEATLITEYLGNDLSKVVNELEKLALNVPAGSDISRQHIQDHIGISKDFNVFELQKALAVKNHRLAYRIVDYFISNPKNHPLVMVISVLFNFFSKVYLLHFMRQERDTEVQKALELSSIYFVREYKTAAKNFPLRETENIILMLKDFDRKAKGINRDNVTDGELLKELIFNVLHPR